MYIAGTSNMLPGNIYVDGNMLPGNKLLTVYRQHNNYSFMLRSTCIPLYPATDRRQTGISFVADTKTRWRQQATPGVDAA